MRSFQPQRLQKPDKQNIFKMASSAFFLGIIVSRGKKIFRYRMRLSLKNIDRDTFHWNRFSDFRAQTRNVFLTSLAAAAKLRATREISERFSSDDQKIKSIISSGLNVKDRRSASFEEKKMEEKLKTELTFFFYFSCRSSVFFHTKA